MKVVDFDDFPELTNAVATIGIFDGVHKGHKYILNSLIQRAKETGGDAVVITLWPHPRIVLNKDVWNFKLLHSHEEKINHLSKLGIDYFVTIPFTEELAKKNACDFVKEYLIEKLGISRLLLGYDNSFGKDRLGNPDGLAGCAKRSGLEVEKLKEFKEGQLSNISSSSVRHALLEGDLDAARKMLDYDYYLKGNVVIGNQLGRKIGFPTANVHPQTAYKLIPRDGVYAVHIEVEGEMYPGMLNIGVRPTLASAQAVKVIEAHLFDVDIDLYDKEIVIHFRKRIRNEMKFSSLKALTEHLYKDKKEIKEFFSGK